MLFDDLDFFLLQAASRFGMPIAVFNCLDPGRVLNIHNPLYSQDEVVNALAELFARGDIIAHLDAGRRSRQPDFVPTRDEIEAALHGAVLLYYNLTPQGGAHWERLAQADWSRYIEEGPGFRFTTLECQSREYLEYRLELEHRAGTIKGSVEWKQLEHWQPTVWKTLPHAWQARYRAQPESTKRCCVDVAFPPPWEQRMNEWTREPLDLAERRSRTTPREPVAEDRWPLKRLQQRMGYRWPARESFAAACAYVQRVDSDAVMRFLDASHSSALRFAAIRELVRRRETSAVPSLIRALWRQHPQAALWALGEFADDRALPVLSVLLEWGFHTGRGIAESSYSALARAVAGFGDRALPLIERELCADGDHDRAEAILRLIDSPRSRAMLKQEPEQAPWRERERQRRIAWALYEDTKGALPEDPIPALIAVLTARDWHRRRLAVDMLVELDNPIAAAHIARLGGDPEWEVRASAACALRHWNVEAEVLKTLVSDANAAVRWLANHRLR